MSTLTAMEARPLIFKISLVEIPLVLATPEDMKEVGGYDENGEEVYVIRKGMIYWLKSILKNTVEPTPRIITEYDDPNKIKDWLDNNMIYICKCWHNT
jgi:hypothetical protein